MVVEREIENVIADLRRQRTRLDQQLESLRRNESTETLLARLRELRERMRGSAETDSDADLPAPAGKE
jgi:hypothetical protein